MDKRLWRLATMGLVIVGGFASPAASIPTRAAVSGEAPSESRFSLQAEPGLDPTAVPDAAPLSEDEVEVALGQAEMDVVSIDIEGDEVTVCVRATPEELEAEAWSGIESVNEGVRRALTDVSWTTLFVCAWDETEGQCRDVSAFAPETVTPAHSAEAVPPAAVPRPHSAAAAEFPQSLAGKTVYVSAGHGWFYNGTTWRTQRPVYQGFIEDHNNAEVVTQYLIPYLENAGATVIPIRERDWSRTSVIADNDQGSPTYTESGTWSTGVHPGYDGGSYRYANAQSTTASATAVWRLSVPTAGTYAVYAWVHPGSNRIRDARYTVAHAGGSSEVVLDQRVMPQTWRYLGAFPFHAGTATVTLDNRTAYEAGVVVADALRLGGGTFDSLAGLSLMAPATSYAPSTAPSVAPGKPWWESSTFYWAQRVGFTPADWPYFNDVVARPMFARWHQQVAGNDAVNDAVYISWHTNGYNGTARGTESYIHNGSTYPVTPGSAALQAAVHDELIRDIRAGWDSAWVDRGKKRADLGEVRMLWDPDYPQARIPGVLLEIAFHDNILDGNALKEPVFNQLTARAVYQGIVKYFDAQDGRLGDLVQAPEPPTALRVQNVGGGSLRVAWALPPTDAVGLGGGAATGYRVYTSPDGFAWGVPTRVTGTSLTISNLAPRQTLYVRVTGTNAGGESMPTEVLGARVGEARLLLVDGFDRLSRFGLVVEDDPIEKVNLRMLLNQINSRAYVVHHGQVVPDGYAWDSASNEAVIRGDLELMAYGVVDWILGEEMSDALDQTERSLLKAYLAAGRGLLISGSDYAWELEAQGQDPDFLHHYLYTDYVADDAGTYTVRPTASGIFAGLPDLNFDAPGEYDVNSPDVLAPYVGSGAQVALTYVGGTAPGSAAAIQHAVPTSGGLSCRRVLAMGFPFEALRPAERAAVMARALAYLDCVVNTTIFSPENGKYYKTTPPFNGSVSGADVQRVELTLQRADGLYWTSAGWSSTLTWLPAQPPPDAWSYWVPLGEGTYTLRARAIGAEAIDDTPASVTFGLDITAPAAVSVITPTGGVLVTVPLVNFVWTVLPPDGGSPLRYEVELDGRVYGYAPSSPYGVVPRPGLHTWRVRAVDAAGNVGPWTALSHFEVSVKEVFLPLVLKQ